MIIENHIACLNTRYIVKKPLQNVEAYDNQFELIHPIDDIENAILILLNN